jgi:putative DNA-invertase from lambdoid prophage Rac
MYFMFVIMDIVNILGAFMKVALYARVSTDEQNIEQQRQLLIEYCNQKGYQFRTFKDEAMSGTINDRPEWVNLLKECERKQFDALLVVKTDRITRSLKYAIWFYDWLMSQKPLKLISIYDSIDLDTPDGYFTFMLNCLLSERELIINKWRSRIGIERAKKEGKYKGGKVGRICKAKV